MSLPPVVIPLGAMRFNSDSQKLEYFNGEIWMQVHTFNPDLNGGARAFWAGGYTYPNGACANNVEMTTISTAGNSTDWCNLSASLAGGGNCADGTRAIYAGGKGPAVPGGSYVNQIQYTTFSSQADYVDGGGDLSGSGFCSGLANSTRGIFSGFTPYSDKIEYITIQSIGNAVDFGNLTATRGYTMQCASSTRGLFCGGINNPSSPSINIIDYVTIASTGDAEDFGDTSGGATAYEGTSFSNSTRGFTAGGYRGSYTSRIDYVTIATKGNAVDFGNLLAEAPGTGKGGASSPTRGLIAGGYSPSSPHYSYCIQYITLQTAGDAVDFGDLSGFDRRMPQGGCSNAHGGLG